MLVPVAVLLPEYVTNSAIEIPGLESVSTVANVPLPPKSILYEANSAGASTPLPSRSYFV